MDVWRGVVWGGWDLRGVRWGMFDGGEGGRGGWYQYLITSSSLKSWWRASRSVERAARRRSRGVRMAGWGEGESMVGI